MKAVFLDRDGVLNVERGQYTFKVEEFHVLDGIIPMLHYLKSLDYHLIVITNQAGIAKGLYKESDVYDCHAKLQGLSGNVIDDIYLAPDHPDYSQSLSRKPDSLMFEKAIARYQIDPFASWMIGDKERDLIPAKKLGMKTILLSDKRSGYADHMIKEVSEIKMLID